MLKTHLYTDTDTHTLDFPPDLDHRADTKGNLMTSARMGKFKSCLSQKMFWKVSN